MASSGVSTMKALSARAPSMAVRCASVSSAEVISPLSSFFSESAMVRWVSDMRLLDHFRNGEKAGHALGRVGQHIVAADVQGHHVGTGLEPCADDRRQRLDTLGIDRLQLV